MYAINEGADYSGSGAVGNRVSGDLLKETSNVEAIDVVSTVSPCLSFCRGHHVVSNNLFSLIFITTIKLHALHLNRNAGKAHCLLASTLHGHT